MIENAPIPEFINPFDYVWIITYTAVIMSVGVSIGGKKIVDNIGKQMVELDNKQALMSDITTVLALLIASITGLPISTTHAKTISIVAIGQNKNSKIDKTKIMEICKAWFLNFPISGLIGFMLAILIERNI